MLEQFFWECENLPDYRHTPEVENILNEDPYFDKKENPTEEEIKENEKWWQDFRASPVVQFLARAEEIADEVNRMELKDNEEPYRKEDKKLWQAVPHVIGLDGRPMPRKATKTREESDDKFWDFPKQFFFGLWGFRRVDPLMLLRLLDIRSVTMTLSLVFFEWIIGACSEFMY
ncbi:hypothetical protein PTKIN_Ptkin13bG0302400 [Pterospermum kingtungense]